MKTIFLFFISVLFVSSLTAQTWEQHLPSKAKGDKLTFYEIQNAFYKEYPANAVPNGKKIVNGNTEKIAGWKLFKRWEHYWENRIDPTTGAFPETTLTQIRRSNSKVAITGGGRWTNMGPTSSNGGYAGSGRVNCIAFHPTNDNTFWVGTPAGGIWKTTDGGLSWTTSSDNNDVLGVSSIALSPNFPVSNTMFIGTGDRDGGSGWSLGGGQSNDNHSIGILKSTDGGDTWITTGFSYNASQRESVNKILINPDNSQIMLVATTEGIYRSTDGGDTWSKKTISRSYIDMEYNTGEPNTVYASTQENPTRIYRSTNGGDTWSQVNSVVGARTELAVSANQPSWVYSIVANRNGGLEGIYKSTDNGANFSKIFGDGANSSLLASRCDASGENSGQGTYDLSIASDPTNANVVFIGGVNTWKSTDAGVTWSLNTHWVNSCNGNATIVHADKHCHEFQNGTSVLFEGNDGGIYKSTDGGDNWSDLTNGLSISQLYRIGVSKSSSTKVICGLQDNGTKLYDNNNWTDVFGGDGMECAIDPINANIQYITYVRGDLHKSTNGGARFTSIKPQAAGLGYWVTPYQIDPNNNQTIYAGYSDVWKTTNSGSSWSKISNIAAPNKLRSLAVAPSNSSFIYTAELNKLWKTTDGGVNWTNITGTIPVHNASITYIAVKDNDANTVWVTLGAYNNSSVYQTTDAGTTWTNISAGLPSAPVMSIVQNKQNVASNELYVATDVGVYKKDGDINWTAYCNLLPNVVVTELEFFYDDAMPENTRLRAATYGRGLWETELVDNNNIVEAPSNFATEALSTSSIKLTWADNSDNETGFVIESKTGAGNFAQVATVNPDVLTYTNTGLTANTTYTYRVKATDGTVNSGYTAEVNGTTNKEQAGDKSKVTLTIIPDKYAGEIGWKLKDASGSVIQSVSFGTYSGSDNIVVEFNLDKACYDFVISDKIGDGICCDYGNGSYTIKDESNNELASGDDYGAGETKNFCIGGNGQVKIINAPTDMGANVTSSSAISLSWTDNSNNETGFVIESKTGAGNFAQVATVGANVLTYANTGLTASTAYIYRVKATDGTVNSGYTADVSATTQADGGAATGKVTLTLVFDQYATETSWELKNTSGDVVDSETYYSQAANSTVTKEFDLADACYDFVIKDMAGDGMCCTFGNGSYELKSDNGTVLASGGEFKKEETKNFCIGGALQPILLSINKENSKEAVSYYPNPVIKGVALTVDLKESVYDQLAIIDIKGVKVVELNIQGMATIHIPTQNLSTGLYNVLLTGENVKKTFKFIVKE